MTQTTAPDFAALLEAGRENSTMAHYKVLLELLPKYSDHFDDIMDIYMGLDTEDYRDQYDVLSSIARHTDDFEISKKLIDRLKQIVQTEDHREIWLVLLTRPGNTVYYPGGSYTCGTPVPHEELHKMSMEELRKLTSDKINIGPDRGGQYENFDSAGWFDLAISNLYQIASQCAKQSDEEKAIYAYHALIDLYENGDITEKQKEKTLGLITGLSGQKEIFLDDYTALIDRNRDNLTDYTNRISNIGLRHPKLKDDIIKQLLEIGTDEAVAQIENNSIKLRTISQKADDLMGLVKLGEKEARKCSDQALEKTLERICLGILSLDNIKELLKHLKSFEDYKSQRAEISKLRKAFGAVDKLPLPPSYSKKAIFNAAVKLYEAGLLLHPKPEPGGAG